MDENLGRKVEEAMLRRVLESSSAIVRLISVLFLVSTGIAQAKPIITVNCDAGQSLNGTLSNLNKRLAITVFVTGTCTEDVAIVGFDGLNLKGQPGATLTEPGTDSSGGLSVFPLFISASRSVTVDGFAIHTMGAALAGIGVGQSSVDVRLRNLTVDGASSFGIEIFEGSQASLAGVNVRNTGFATLAVFDLSDVHIESSLFENITGTPFHEGLFVGSGHVTVQSTTIRNMQVGIDISAHGSVDTQSFNTYFPVSANRDVVIDNPASANVQGALVQGGSALNLGDTKLRITNAGQPRGGNTAAVWITDGSTLTDGNGNLVISGSLGQGVLVSNNSHATLSGSSITGSAHGGLVMANYSTIAVTPSASPTQVSGNGVDVFCDNGGLTVLTGSANIIGVSTFGGSSPLFCFFPQNYLEPLP